MTQGQDTEGYEVSAQGQKTSPLWHPSDMETTSRPEPSLDVLTPLLQSLMIGSTLPAEQPLKSELGLKGKLVSQLRPDRKLDLKPKSMESVPKPVPVPEQKVDPSRCARCNLLHGADRVSYDNSCCKRSICAPCLSEALNDRIQKDLWHQLGSPQWMGCLANICQNLGVPRDLITSVEAVPSHPLFQRTLDAAQRARNALENIRPRPTRNECELAQRLHKALVEHKLMPSWTEVDIEVISTPLFPVRSGFLTQPVPILTSMLKRGEKTCTSCSTTFQAVDTSNEAAWSYVSMTFPGDWTWMVLGRPSKAVLPECAGKHSLDICPACLPKLIFSGLEFIDAVSGSGNYRFTCPLCKHTLSPVQVERIARLIDPSRTPTTLSGISVSASFASGLSKPAALPQTVTSLLGPSNKSKILGGGSPKPADAETSAQKEAIMSAIVSNKPNVKWDDVAGLTPAKHELQRAIVFPARFPNLYDEKRKASGAILLYGPPGTGKSYLAKAVATEVDHTFFSISSGDVVSKWMGESEKLVRQLFTLARQNKPSIIFIDEIDALCSNREGSGSEKGSEHSSRMKTEILVQLDGLHAGSDGDNTGVVVLAATNLPWALDPAFRRRFEPRIYIPLPDRAARRQLLGIHAGARWGGLLSGGDVEDMAGLTEGFSGSDVANVVKQALSAPLRAVQTAGFFKVVKGGEGGEEMYTPCGEGEEGAVEMTWEAVPKNRLLEPPVTAAYFLQVLRERRVKSSVGVGELQRYEDWTHEFGVEGSH